MAFEERRPEAEAGDLCLQFFELRQEWVDITIAQTGDAFSERSGISEWCHLTVPKSKEFESFDGPQFNNRVNIFATCEVQFAQSIATESLKDDTAKIRRRIPNFDLFHLREGINRITVINTTLMENKK